MNGGKDMMDEARIYREALAVILKHVTVTDWDEETRLSHREINLIRHIGFVAKAALEKGKK